MSKSKENYDRIIGIFKCNGNWERDKKVLQANATHNANVDRCCNPNSKNYLLNGAVALKIRTPLDMTGGVEKDVDKFKLVDANVIKQKIQQAHNVASSSKARFYKATDTG